MASFLFFSDVIILDNCWIVCVSCLVCPKQDLDRFLSALVISIGLMSDKSSMERFLTVSAAARNCASVVWSKRLLIWLLWLLPLRALLLETELLALFNL